MDTRFWGPSGWRLLHLIAMAPATPQVEEWFSLLQYVLPCKYCRASFSDYLDAQPLTTEIRKSPQKFSRWMYEIHNRVNAKLRGQGVLTQADPSWPSVKAHFQGLYTDLCKGLPFLGWDFMTSVAFTTPAADYVPAPMPDAPENPADWSDLDEKTQNRYNLLTRAERLRYLAAWWRLIPSILPCARWRKSWAAAMARHGQPPLAAGRGPVLRWMWRIEEDVCAGLRCPTPHRSLSGLRREVYAFSSGCATQKRGVTCRARREKRREHFQTRRQQRGGGLVFY